MTSIDPVTLAVLGHGLVAIPEEMGVNLFRSSYSTIVREVRDISTALMDRHGNTVAISQYIPQLLNAIQPALEGCLEYFSLDDLKPGEGLVNNDPFHGGQHLNDIFLYTPVYVDGELIGVSASVAHHLDLGGGAPGSNAEATDIYSEGLVIPPIKVDFSGDWEQGVFGRLFQANVRVPIRTIADFNGQIAANRTGERRLAELARKWGKDTLLTAMAELQDYSERLVRAAIAKIPDGVYRGESFMEDDGLGGGPFTVRVQVIVKGSDVRLDFEGTDPQARGFINVPFASTVSAVHTTMMCVLGAGHVTANAGSFRPISITAPLGTILNPHAPAPTRGRTSACYKAYDAIVTALAPVLPHNVLAPGFDCQTGLLLSQRTPTGRQHMFSEVLGAGNGASHHLDGADGMIMPLTNGQNTPMETIEAEYPFVSFERYGLIPDSGAPGQHRGGLGMERVYRILTDDVFFSSHSDRHNTGAPGLFGGGVGQPARFAIQRGDETIRLPSKVNAMLRAGDVLYTSAGGGGGYGPPEARAITDIEHDLREGRITEAHARAAYPQWSVAQSPAAND